MKKYLVTMDGWTAGYGATIYVVGLFDTPEKAEEAIKKCIGNVICREYSVDIQPNFTISEITEGEIYLPKKDSWDSFQTDIYLGGYAE